jgi:hypothetical protein
MALLQRRAFKLVAVLFVAAALAALHGCATAPSVDVMKAETASFQLPRAADPGKGLVYVVRPSMAGTLVRFNVFLDDQNDSSEMGYTRGNEYIHFSVAPGEHRIYSKAENWAEIAITVKAGEIVFLQQHAAMGLIMARNTLSRIEDYQGKYYIKSATAGTISKAEKYAAAAPVPMAAASSAPTPASAAPQAAGTPAALAAFVGTWDGRWAGRRVHTLVVENIEGRSAQLNLSRSEGGGKAARSREPGSERVAGALDEDGSLRATLSDGTRVVYRISGDRRSLSGQWQRNEGVVDGVFTRREAP